MIRAMLVDDFVMVRAGLRRFLEAAGGFEVVAEASDGMTARELYAEHHPDVVVLDLVMPNKDGLDATKEIRSGWPDARILLMTGHGSHALARRAVDAGARGFIDKHASAEELLAAIGAVAAGERVVPEHWKDEPASLTDRELQVLTRIAAGTPNPDIAAELHISVRTLDSHRRNVLRKLGLRNNADLTRYAVREGLVVP